MSSLRRELVFLILQFLDEEKFTESVHKLEQESGYFFNLRYFEEKALLGEWDEVDKYLSGFTKFDDNMYSMRIFFEIRKQKYLEALDRHDKAKAVEILAKDLKVFSTFNEEIYKEIALLLTLENFRENKQLSNYGDTKSARGIVIAELRKMIESNPLFKEKLALPHFGAARLRTLINQSLNWQHQLCENPKPNPDIESLFTDHTCSPQNGARAPTPVLPAGAVTGPSTYAPLGVHGVPFQPMAPAPNANALAGWMLNPNPYSSVPGGVMASFPFPMQPNQAAMLKHPRPFSNSLGMMDYQSLNHEQPMKRLRFGPTVDELTYPAHPQPATSLDDLPRYVASTIRQGSEVTSMDFHPSHHTLLTVGCSSGDVTLWEVGNREKVVTEPFKIWNMTDCSLTLQGSIVKDPSISVSRVSWSPDGNLIGVAFTKHLIHIHAYQESQLREHLELDAHVGCVNDLAFAHPNKQLCVVTCGDDKCIKVWELSGKKLYTFEGHEAPVYSICPHQKENVQFIFSTALDGKIKAWLYDNVGSRVNYDAPGKWCTTMLYSADGSRLFSCGTSKDGDSFLVEWNESEGSIKRTYLGFRKKSTGVVQFDTTRNRFLAVGEDNQVKFWDMDNTNLLSAVEADGGLPSLPRLRFNKEGSLLAVTTADNGFKILANVHGLRTLRVMEVKTEMKVSSSAMVTSSSPAIGKMEQMDNGPPAMPAPIPNEVDAMLRTTEKPRNVESVEKSKPLELMEVVDPDQCQQVTMPDSKDSTSKVARLLYTNSGDGILALGTNGIQRLWKWSRGEQNPTGKATTSVTPQHWQPNNGLLMTNDVPENSEETVPCIALSKNDSYVMSACGGKVSLFNIMTFKVMTTFMPPPPAATFLAFHPQDNNVMAIGTKDSTIHIYDVRVNKVKTKLKGHQNHITSLAFSAALNILVSSSADAELFFWSVDSWEKKNSLVIQLPVGKTPIGETRVQFHNDHVHLLVSHETQIAIYDASKMECIHKWVPQESLSSSITCASYSCNSQQVYASFADGNIGVFDAEYLRPRCRIASSAYIPQPTPNSAPITPLVITTHPQEPNQIAIGLSDGSVKVLETPEPSSASAANNSGSDQIQR